MSSRSELRARVSSSRNLLLVDAGRGYGCCLAGLYGLRLLCWLPLGKVAVIPEVLVEVASEFGGLRPEGRTSAFKEDDRDDAAVLRIGVGGEPPETGAVIGAGTRLTHDRELIKVGLE